MALIDTGFCPDKLSSKIIIEPVLDLTKSALVNCKNPTGPRFHGQLVLKEFLKFIDSKKKIHLYPLVVFDAQGEQKKEYWKDAIEWLSKNKIDLVLTASGLITNEKFIAELPGIWFVPSGRVTPQIKDKDALFPQSLAPKENLFLIGDYYDGRSILYDSGLLYKERIDYYFPSGVGEFIGTSRAVAEAAARAINRCPLKSMRSCLKKLSKEYIDGISHLKVQTYD